MVHYGKTPGNVVRDIQPVLPSRQNNCEYRTVTDAPRQYHELSVVDDGRTYRFAWRSDLMTEIVLGALKFAAAEGNILLISRSGGGKTLLARTLHGASPRAAEPFEGVYYFGDSSDAAYRELFGAERGSFAGSIELIRGKFELAQSGTVFLDNLHNHYKAIQRNLLQVCDHGYYTRFGGKKRLRTNARIIAATEEEPADLVEKDKLIEALYSRLNRFPVRLPPLCARPEDALPLVLAIVAQHNESGGGSGREFSSGALTALEEAAKQLENIRTLEDLVARADALVDRKERARILGEDIKRARDWDSPLFGLPAQWRTPVELDIGLLRELVSEGVVQRVAAERLGYRNRDALNRAIRRVGLPSWTELKKTGVPENE